MASTSTPPPRSPAQRTFSANGSDERGDYKAVPLEEDIIGNNRNPSAELPASPSALFGPWFCALSTNTLYSAVWAIASYCVSSILMTVINKVCVLSSMRP